MKKILLYTFSFFVLTGCTQGIYKWNGYDNALYQYYKAPGEKDKFVERLHTIITEGEGTNSVPPGIYAEYGYVQYESGNYVDAEKYFQKEYDRWPESRIIMSKMIQNAKMSQERENNKKVEEVNDIEKIQNTNAKENL